MILDSEMRGLGFKKVKSYQQKENGVSSFVWEHESKIQLTIEKDDFIDNGDKFHPVLRTGLTRVSFTRLESVRKLISLIQNEWDYNW